MDLEQLREYLSDITLEEILKIDTELGVLRMYFKNFKDIPSIPEETLVFYDEISDISALVEKKYPEFLKQICGYDKVKFVRATEYVLKEQPNIGIEDLNVFAELAEAWQNAENEAETEKYTVIMTALQVLGCVVADIAPALDPERENEIKSYSIFGGPKREEKEESSEPRLDYPDEGPVVVKTFDDMKKVQSSFDPEKTLFDIYLDNLNYLDMVLHKALKYRSEAMASKKKRKYDYISALYCLYCADKFLENLDILEVETEVSPNDTSPEACKYRDLALRKDEHCKALTLAKEEVLSLDEDLPNKYEIFKKYRYMEENLNDGVANKAYMLYAFKNIEEGVSPTFSEVASNVNKLKKMGDKGYTKAYIYAVILNYMVYKEIEDYENSPIKDHIAKLDSEPFTIFSCETDITGLLATYFFKCYNYGKDDLDRFECEVFCTLYEEYGDTFDFRVPLMKTVISMANIGGDYEAVAAFLRIMNRYVKDSKRKEKKREKFANAVVALNEEKEIKQVTKTVGYTSFAALWAVVSVAVPLIYTAFGNCKVPYFISIGVLAGLLVAELIFMQLFPRTKIFHRLVILGGTLLSFASAFYFGAVLKETTLDFFGGHHSLMAHIFAPVFCYTMPCLTFSFSNIARLRYMIKTACFFPKSIIKFVLVFVVLVSFSYTYNDFLIDLLGGFFGIILTLALLLALIIWVADCFDVIKQLFVKRRAEYITFILLLTLISFIIALFKFNEASGVIDRIMLYQTAGLVVSFLASGSFKNFDTIE